MIISFSIQRTEKDMGTNLTEYNKLITAYCILVCLINPSYICDHDFVKVLKDMGTNVTQSQILHTLEWRAFFSGNVRCRGPSLHTPN